MLHPFPSRVWVWATPSLPGYMVLQGSCPRKPWHVGHVGKCSRLTLKISKNSTWWPRKLGVQFHYVPFISRHTITYGCHIMLYQCYIPSFEVLESQWIPWFIEKVILTALKKAAVVLVPWLMCFGSSLVCGCWLCMVFVDSKLYPWNDDTWSQETKWWRLVLRVISNHLLWHELPWVQSLLFRNSLHVGCTASVEC